MDAVSGHLAMAEVEDQIAQAIGRAVGQMHAADVTHGDLTTSNMLWRNGTLVCG